MDTITEENMAIEMWYKEAVGALHRFNTIEENVKLYEAIRNASAECLVSIGICDGSLNRLKALYEAKARMFIIDVAHAHTSRMRDYITYIKSKYSDIFLIVGNVGTPNAVRHLEIWGADCVKVGIANGAVCRTEAMTGVRTPMITAINECANAATKPIIADGGMRDVKDVCKALAAGASFVMTGTLFKHCTEKPSNTKDLYRGSSSYEHLKYKEGASEQVEITENACDVLSRIDKGLRSCMSYVGANDIYELHEKVKFGIVNR